MYSYIQWLYVSNIKNLCQEALLIALCILGAAAFDVDESNEWHDCDWKVRRGHRGLELCASRPRREGQ